MKFKEVRIIRHDSVRSMCIKEEYYTRGTNTESELPENGNQDVGARRKLRKELQSLCGLTETQAINILNGFCISEYMWINEREWVKNERKRIKAENT